MKSISILVFLFLAINITNAQNIDKLTLKGGVMLGVPKYRDVNINTANRNGQCFNCLPGMETNINLQEYMNFNFGLEYTPIIKKFNNENFLGFYTGLNLMLISSTYEYHGKQIYFEDVKGKYNIYSLVSGLPLGVKYNFSKYKIEIAINTRINFYKNTIDFVMQNKHEPYLIYERKQENENVAAYLTHGFSVKYNYKEKMKFYLAIDSPLFNLYENLPIPLNTKSHIGNVYPYHYHQISLGLTYQLLSHKNKTIQNTN